MAAEVEYKGEREWYEETNSKIKGWMPPHVMMDFMDHKKQKHLVVVVVLPTGVVQYNPANTNIEVGSPQDEVQVRIIWPKNMTDVMKLLSQFLHTCHGYDLNTWRRQSKEKNGFCLVKGEHPLPFTVLLKLSLSSSMIMGSMH